ncbi:MAG: hypothetical protein ACREMQ_05870 [Longimicrobiales bacterium]
MTKDSKPGMVVLVSKQLRVGITLLIASLFAYCGDEPTGVQRPSVDKPSFSTTSAAATWDGEAGNGLWSDALNWVGNTLPSPLADIEIPSNAGTVHVNTAVTIDGTMTMGANVVLEVDAGAVIVHFPGVEAGTR